MKTKQVLGVFGALALTGLSTLILASPAQAAAEVLCLNTRTSVTQLNDRPDSGTAGTWAYDTFVRTVEICEIGPAPEGQGRSTYHAVVHDVGTFKTIAGSAGPRVR